MQFSPDAIPSSEQLQETLFDRIYYPYQKQIWTGGTILMLAIITFLGLREHRESRENEMWGQYYALLDVPARNADAYRERAESLQALYDEYPTDSVSPHVMRAMIQAQAAAGPATDLAAA